MKLFKKENILLYRSSPRLILSAANDGVLLGWGHGGGIVDTISVCLRESNEQIIWKLF